VVDLDARVITLPPERVKNGRVHTIPLSDTAMAILTVQHRRVDDNFQPRDLIFGIGQGGFDGYAPPKRKLDARIAAVRGAPLAHWVVHDLRRACASGMAEIGIEPAVIEACLNHQSGTRAGIAGIYNRSRLEGQKRNALDRWDAHLRAVFEGNAQKVVPLAVIA
jgi:integrase